MAFLDNSGDIILDAVLTEAGRKLMASGDFQIVKFAMGDDEINYGLYNKSHASGSAYYDLEILQTPILEASTAINAGINYGLLSIPNPSLLYMPTMKRNQISSKAVRMQDKVFYLAVNDGTTYDALVTAFGGIAGGGDKKVLKAGEKEGFGIMIETGLDTKELAGTAANRTSYLSSTGLSDTGFDVSVDTRFIATVYGPSATDTFGNTPGSGESITKISLKPSAPSSKDRDRKHYSKAKVKAIANNVLKRESDTKADTATSVIAGPRSSVVSLNFDTKIIPDETFSKFGKTGQTISGASGTYKYIDTTVKVVSSTGVVEQLPVRIVKKE
jgi:hypothetical protein